jgi:hypothetical protein
MERCLNKFVPNRTRRMNRLYGQKIKSKKDASFQKKTQKFAIAKRKEEYCNPGCKGTIYQDGKFTHKDLEDLVKRNPFSAEWTKEDRKKVMAIYRKQRIKMFGKTKKRSVLKNNFYEDFSERCVAKLKKQGAISGCDSSCGVFIKEDYNV